MQNFWIIVSMLNITLRRSFAYSVKCVRVMSTTQGSSAATSHAERTAAEPRDDALHKVILGDVRQINDCIRVYRLNIPQDGQVIRFLAGQWLDVHIPGIPKPGGFTITSSPHAAMFMKPPSRSDGKAYHAGYLELAVQKSPDNPAAAWLWRPVPEILGQELQVRVGGSFVWRPPNVNLQDVTRVVLVAGGMGINPFMSMIAMIGQEYRKSFNVTILYSVRDPGDQGLSSILYLESFTKLFNVEWVKGELVLHLTSGGEDSQSEENSIVELAGCQIKCRRRRITKDDFLGALGTIDERRSTVVYICGVPLMTDELVEVAQHAPGMDPKRVLCERWW